MDLWGLWRDPGASWGTSGVPRGFGVILGKVPGSQVPLSPRFGSQNEHKLEQIPGSPGSPGSGVRKCWSGPASHMRRGPGCHPMTVVNQLPQNIGSRPGTREYQGTRPGTGSTRGPTLLPGLRPGTRAPSWRQGPALVPGQGLGPGRVPFYFKRNIPQTVLALRGSDGVDREGLWFVCGSVLARPALSNPVNYNTKSMSPSPLCSEMLAFSNMP